MSTPSPRDIRLAEALVFASAEPVSELAVAELLRSRTAAGAPDTVSGRALDGLSVPDDISGDGPDGVTRGATDLALGNAPDTWSGRGVGAVTDTVPAVVSGTMPDAVSSRPPDAAFALLSAAPSDDTPIDGLHEKPTDAPGAAVGTSYARLVLLSVQARFADRGVVLSEVANGWQFRTAPDLAPALTTVLERPRRLPRVAMETLAIVAYHQPCTRTDIEAIRGVSLGQSTLDQLLESGLIAPRGRKEVPGRPILWGTSPSFLQRFGLATLHDLPRREELLVDLPSAGAGAGADGAVDEAVDAGGRR